LKNNKKGGLPQGAIHPCKISLRTSGDREYQELRNFVGVQAGDGRLHLAGVSDPGLDHEQDFSRGFKRTLPLVNRLHTRQDIDTRSQTLLDQAMGDTFGLLAISAGGQDNLKIGHMFTKYASFYFRRKNFLLSVGVH
jgi:hypothetical protein